MTFTDEEYETWQVTALRKLCQLQLQIVEGEIADLTQVSSELRAIAEMLSGLSIPSPFDFIHFATDGGVYSEDEV